ncbi:MAG TPA: methyltransferase domain-containing protein [Candidatus Acidoferrales bacterium]|nr:methyltransferase domain-containing protein [Candidatus Acidoferrales bacterium]
MARTSTLAHWESYWKGHRGDIEDTYSTRGRLVREVLADGPVEGRWVMEIGAGSGRDLLELARAGARGIVLDYSPASLALVRDLARRQGVTVQLVQADATRMPFRDGAIDVSFHQGLLEHFRDPLPLLRENARVTARTGRLIVDVPQTFHPYTLMKKVMIAFGVWFAGWETQFTPAGLERRCREAGLEVVRSYGDWMVPGLWYRVLRESLKRGLRVRLPLEPRGPRAWAAGWERWRASLRRRRWALWTCHVIGTVARPR